MATTADIEKLFKQYVEEERFECADALYLCAQFGKSDAARILWLRYGMASPLAAALEDLKQLGISDLDLRLEDTNIKVSETIIATFESICLNELLKRAEEKLKNLSQLSKALLWFMVTFGKESFENLYRYGLFYKLLEVIFQLKVDRRAVDIAMEELVRSYFLQHVTIESYKRPFPNFFDKMVEMLRSKLETYLPRIEVRVKWSSD